MLRSGIRLFSLLLFMVPVSLASAQDAGPPKTIAFVVGVQHYDDPDLNKLQYTVKDAQDVFERLEAVTDLDLERSRLLLADPNSADEADPNDPEWVVRKSKLGLQEIQDELANFLELVRNDETVVFYFGGHGTVQAEKHVLFLPSDYSRRPQRRFWRYSNIIDDIGGSINARMLRNVSVVFFANMCGAGTAAGDMSADQGLDEEFVKEWRSKNTLGFERFALFPASAPNQNTFEHPEFKRSVFAHHLVEGLRGGAATDGVITAESLFSYLDAKIQDDLPRDPRAFDPKIRIGVTRELEGHALYLNGLSLLSDALDTDNPLFWRLAQRNLQEAARFSGVGRVGTLAALRLAQLRASQGGDVTELSGILAPVTGSAATDTGVRAAAASLLEATKREASQRFVAVIVSSGLNDWGEELWKDFLQGFPGELSVDEILISERENEEVNKVNVVTKLKELRTKYGSSGDVPHLIFVYSGVSSVNPLYKSIRFPFKVGVYRELIDLWRGGFTLIYDSPFGGPLKKAFEEGLFGDISLVLAAKEMNGWTVDKGETELVIELLKSNVIDLTNWAPIATYRAKAKVDLGPAFPTYVVGTPYVSRSQRSPSPVFAGATGAMRETSAILSPVRRLASLIATGCDPGCARFAPGPVETAIENDGAIGAIGKIATLGSPETEPLYDLLKKATLFDFGGHVERADAGYRQFLELFEQAHRTAADLPAAESQLRASARSSLARMTGQVRNRLEGLEGKLTREVHLLLAGVQEYRSPLVPDVADTKGDLGAWKAILEASGIWGRDSTAGASSVPMNLHVINTSSRRQLLETLGDALTKVADDDLVLFVFSGRGIELEGERYLAPADVGMKAEASYSPPVNPQHAIAAKASSDMSQPLTEELVSIAEIAELARGRWFVGIYDAQFTEPVFEAGRADGLLDKHLNSVRPSPSETAATSPELELILEGDKDFPGTHVHIWGEGRLTERLSAPVGCEADPVRKVRSPMTAALLATLQEDSYGTYGDWIQRAQEHPCLAANFTFIVQGAHDLPRFASGNAATQIPYFLSGRERRDTNLDVADGITAIASQSGDHPLFSLSRAAVLVALTEFDSAAPPREEQVPADRLNEALDLLRELHGSQRVRDSDLEAEVLDLFTRALMLSGDVDQARNRLLQAPSDQLMSDTLQMRLLELTERELRQSPTAILRETEKKLAELDASPNTTARLKMLSSSYEAPRGQYRIVTSTGPSP